MGAARGMFDAAKHPRGFHGRFGQSAVETRAQQRVDAVTHTVRDRRPTRQQGFNWQQSYDVWTHPKRETFDQYKNRVTAAALARGMTQDKGGFFYAPEDRGQRFPMTPQGRPAGVQPTRIERARDSVSSLDRRDAQATAGMSPRAAKFRQSRTKVLERVGYRTVGTHTGQRRAIRARDAMRR